MLLSWENLDRSYTTQSRRAHSHADVAAARHHLAARHSPCDQSSPRAMKISIRIRISINSRSISNYYEYSTQRASVHLRYMSRASTTKEVLGTHAKSLRGGSQKVLSTHCFSNICIYVYVYVYVYAYVYVYVYVMYVYIYIYIYMHMYISLSLYIYIDACVCMYVM